MLKVTSGGSEEYKLGKPQSTVGLGHSRFRVQVNKTRINSSSNRGKLIDSK